MGASFLGPRLLHATLHNMQVFIHKGQLHIIPKPRSPAEITSLPVYTPTIQDAVHIVGDDSIPTLASEPVQRCILERLKK